MQTVSSDHEKLKAHQLWSDFRNGDRNAFEKIYRTYAKDLLSYGSKVISHRSLIEDSMQDLFFELWQSRNNLSHTASIKFYLFKALRFKIVRNAKTKGIDFIDSIDDIENVSFDLPHENNLIELEAETIQSARLKDFIANLPKRQQEAITLRFYHNFSNNEIADIMKVTYQSACKSIYSALKNLKESLKVPFDL